MKSFRLLFYEIILPILHRMKQARRETVMSHLSKVTELVAELGPEPGILISEPISSALLLLTMWIPAQQHQHYLGDG